MLIPQGDYAGKPPLRVQKSVVVVGADEHCHLHLISSSVSRHHALIIRDQDGVYIRDLGSRTKVVINGQPHREALLADEDEIHIGKFSFRFALSGTEVEPAAELLPVTVEVEGERAPKPFTGRTFLIGKGEECDASLSEETVSHRHAVIFTAKGKRFIRDLNSRTGTLLDGEKIHQQELKPGSQVRIGDTIICLKELKAPVKVVEEAPIDTETIPLEGEEPAPEEPTTVADLIPLPLELPKAVEAQAPVAIPVEPEPEASETDFGLALVNEGAQSPAATEEPPVAESLDKIEPAVPEPIKIDLEPEAASGAAEPVEHATEALEDVLPIRSTLDPPVKPQDGHPAVSPAESATIEPAVDPPEESTEESIEPLEPIKLEVEPEVASISLESVLAEVESDLKKSKPAVEIEPEAREPIQQPIGNLEPTTPVEETASYEIELSDKPEPEPATEPAETAEIPAPPAVAAAEPEEEPEPEPVLAAAPEAIEKPPEPSFAVIEDSMPPESPADLSFDLDLHLDQAEPVANIDQPPAEPSDTFQPKIELTATELGSDEPLVTEEEQIAKKPQAEEPIAEAAPMAEIAPPAPIDEPAAAAPIEEPPVEKPRKRPARGRKPAAKSEETKPPKTPRSRSKRKPPVTAEPVEASAPVEVPVPEIAPVETMLSAPEIAAEGLGVGEIAGEAIAAGEIVPEEAPAAEVVGEFAPDEPVAVAPAISVQPQVPEIPERQEEPTTDVWSEMSSDIDESTSEAAVAPTMSDIPEAPIAEEHSSAAAWNLPESSGEEIADPIISEDQTAPSMSMEAEVPDTPPIAEEMTSTDWAIPAAPSEDISAPIVSDPVLTPPKPPVQQSPPPGPRRPAEPILDAPISSIGGFGFLGGGVVNLDHFIGGMPIQLPELPPAPTGFGKVKFDMSGKPYGGRVMPPPPPPQAGGPAAGPGAPQSRPVMVVAAEPPPAAQAPPQPVPMAPPPAPPAEPIVQPPPVSFAPRPERKPAGSDAYRPLDEGFPQTGSPAVSKSPSAFDGLAMGAGIDADVFSDVGVNPSSTSDAAFGGPPLNRANDYAIPESDERANRAAQTPAPDFADDDFWNRTDEQDDAAASDASSSARPEAPLPPPSKEEMSGLQGDEEDSADPQSDASLPPRPAPEPPPAKRRRFRIPFLMPVILIGVVGGLAAIWHFISVQTPITGTLTFVDFTYTPGTQESIDFEAAQRRLLDEQTRAHADEILSRDDPGADQGFLRTPETFDQVAASVNLVSAGQAIPPQTLLQLTTTSSDTDGDRQRMLALLQSLADRNAPQLDANRRIREDLQHAQQNVDDAQQKLDKIKSELAELDPVIESAPPGEQLELLARKKSSLEMARMNAEAAVNHDRADMARLTAPVTADAPTGDDSQIKTMKQQLADLQAEVESARADQLAGAVMARQKLQVASRQFDEQIAAANTLLSGESQLRQFVDSAMDSQTKARDLINMLIVDGEDLELQLEDTMRDVEDLIQTQQADKWALDPQLQSLRENLEVAQHKFNANAGEGVTDPRILDPLQKEIDNWTAQVKQRQAELGADPGELRVQQSLNSIIDALRKKLAKEKHETDEVLDPLEKQLADLDPAVAGLPAAQQDLARQIHSRLDALNDARQKFADAFGDEQLAPTSKVVELKNEIADLKANIAARQADLERAAVAARDVERNGDVATVQTRLATDQQNFENASKDLEAGLSAYDDLHAKQLAAEQAQQKKINLLDDQRTAFADLENARRDRDEKQSAADQAFDIKPVAATDVTANAPPDPRMMYSLGVMGAGLVAVALAALFSRGGPRQSKKKPAPMHPDADFDSLVIPLASDDDHAATA
jgi:pSer/pThr/pTyr-binding forkhead associated (FHA) protein